MITAVVYRLLGYRQVEIPGYRCGCCGSWHDEPRTVWRRRGLLHRWDTIGLCSGCRRSTVEVGFTVKEFMQAYGNDHILFSERMQIAARVDAIMSVRPMCRNTMGVVTALSMIGGLRRPEPWPTDVERKNDGRALDFCPGNDILTTHGGMDGTKETDV